MLCKLFSVLFLVTIMSFQSHAQESSPVKFGHISASDFDISNLTADTVDGAVILADVGYSSVINNYRGFSLEFKRQTRIKIINKNGFDLANIEIALYVDGNSREQLESIKGTTYNLENGKVIETKLGKDAIFEDNYNKYHVLKKFTLPEVKEGSIIEYSYTINSDFLFNLQPWEFQGRYPCLWSEYEVVIPQYLDYVIMMQGYKPFDIKTETQGSELVGSEPVSTSDKRWVIKNVPALKEEKFTSSIKNHISKIEFQLAGINFPHQPYRNVMGDWVKVSEDLLKEEDFGYSLDRNNGWLSDSLKKITAGATNDLDKARKIYYYVKDNIKSNHFTGIYLGKDVKDVFKDKSGSVTDINLLLITMLRHENIKADPVILSTVSHGYTSQIYPIMDKFNYVICKTSIDTSDFFLDASQAYLGFGRLPVYCYNGHARIIDTTALPLYFSADTLEEATETNVILFADSVTNNKWVGNIASKQSYAESNDTREKIAEKGKEDFVKNMQSSNSEDFSISNIEIENLNDYENVIQTTCALSVQGSSSDDIIYFNPMMQNGYKENPLKSLDRKYPVEMPYLIDETYRLNMQIPEGYDVDELPKSVKVNFNDTEAFFDYIITTDGTRINLISHLKFMKATFVSEDYKDLRDFFDYIVKKHSEQIVFKRKK
jgi:hypothetical protein